MFQPPNPIVCCAKCLFSLGFGYDRISRLLFGSTKRRHKVYSWSKYHGWTRTFDSFKAYYKQLRRINGPPKKHVLSAEEHEQRRHARFSRKNYDQLYCYLQTCLNLFLKEGRHDKHVPRLVGCSRQELIAHFESLWQAEMNWTNYGSYWEIDHRIPVSKFDIFTHEGRQACYHFTNLQPLTRHQNRVKATKIQVA